MPRRIVGVLVMVVFSFLLLSVAAVFALRYFDPPVSAFMIRDRFTTHAQETEARLTYQWVDWEKISPTMRLAVVAAEDQKFPYHDGFDVESIRAIIKQQLDPETASEKPRGASTISQQLAKNLFLWPGRNWVRKGLEVYFTVLLELMLSKQRILELYLNVVQFGDNVYGVGAAAWVFFEKPAAEIDADEAALLASVLPNPVRFEVEQPSKYMRKRQRWIKRQMRQLGGAEYLQQL